jgi:nucleotide-binding universal stress UspA family protein
MYKKIVLAVDGSEISMNAAKHAVALAKSTGGELIAIHVVPPIDVMDIESFKPETLLSGLRKEGEKILSEVRDLAAKEGVSIQTHVEDGIPYDRICEVAEDSDADLIIMGSHGRSGIGKVFIGSVAERVISKTKCRPVLVVK